MNKNNDFRNLSEFMLEYYDKMNNYDAEQNLRELFYWMKSDSCKDDAISDFVAEIVEKHYDHIPYQLSKIIIDYFLEKNECLESCFIAIANNFKTIDKGIKQQFLIKASQPDNSLIASEVIEKCFDIIPIPTREALLLKIISYPDPHYTLGYILNNYSDIMSIELREKLLLRLENVKPCIIDVVSVICRHFPELPTVIQGAILRLANKKEFVLTVIEFLNRVETEYLPDQVWNDFCETATESILSMKTNTMLTSIDLINIIIRHSSKLTNNDGKLVLKLLEKIYYDNGRRPYGLFTSQELNAIENYFFNLANKASYKGYRIFLPK